MILLIAGLILWTDGHLLKRVLPGVRSAIDEKLGVGRAKGLFSLVFVASILMMIFGFIHMGPSAVYTPPSWGVHANNTLMLVAVFLMGAGSGKGRAPTLLRHPMLAGVFVWSIAHLLANGDLRSIILFGWLAVWAIGQMFVINMREGAWDRPEPGPLSADVKTVVISLVIYGVIAGIHYLIGPSPFGG